VFELLGIKQPSEGLRYGVTVAYQFGLSAIMLLIKRGEIGKISSMTVSVRTVSEWLAFYQKLIKLREQLLQIDPAKFSDVNALQRHVLGLIARYGKTSFGDPELEFQDLLILPQDSSRSIGSSGYTDPKQLAKLIDYFAQDFQLHQRGEQRKAELRQKIQAFKDNQDQMDKYSLMIKFLRLAGPEYEPFRDMEQVVACADRYLQSVL